jgi:hypothetical protein
MGDRAAGIAVSRYDKGAEAVVIELRRAKRDFDAWRQAV